MDLGQATGVYSGLGRQQAEGLLEAQALPEPEVPEPVAPGAAHEAEILRPVAVHHEGGERVFVEWAAGDGGIPLLLVAFQVTEEGLLVSPVQERPVHPFHRSGHFLAAPRPCCML